MRSVACIAHGGTAKPCAHKPLCSRSRGRRGPHMQCHRVLTSRYAHALAAGEDQKRVSGSSSICTGDRASLYAKREPAPDPLMVPLTRTTSPTLSSASSCSGTCACACACPRARAMCTRNVHVHAQCARTMCMRMRRSACACASHNVYLLGRGEDSKVWIVSRQWPVSDCFRSKELLHQPLQPDAMWPGACPSRIGSLARL